MKPRHEVFRAWVGGGKREREGKEGEDRGWGGGSRFSSGKWGFWGLCN